MVGIAVAAALAAQSPCNAIAGLESVLERDARFVAVGELHGTSEAPAAFADLVCHALKGQPVTVALEFPVQMQPVLDAFMSETSADKARADLLSYTAGPFRFHDGRGSEAMLGLLESLRAMRQAGGDLNVAATVPDSPRVAGFTQAHSELDRAHLWSVLARTAPERRILIFVGSIHAEKARRVGSIIGLPAAAHFRPEEVVSLFIAQQGGEAWNCREECGVNSVPVTQPTHQRGVHLNPEADGSFDGYLALGPSTASPPATAD